MPNWKRTLVINLAAALWVAFLAGSLIARDTARGVIHGVVVSAETGKPLPLAVVAAHGVERPWWRDLRADGEGRFEIRDVPAGLTSFTAHGNVHEMKRPLRVEVRESGRNEVVLRLTAMPPFVRVRSTDKRYQFTPGEQVNLEAIGYSKSEQMDFEVRSLRLDQLRAKAENVGWSGDYRVPRKLGELVRKESRAQAKRDEEGRVTETIGLSLKPGLYSVWAAFPDAADGVVISVSQIGLVTKFDGRRLLGYVQDLVENRPVEGARVEMFADGKRLGAGSTGQEGTFTLTPDRTQLSVVAILGDSYALAQAYAYGSGEQGEYRVYLYTDRPVYRPGQVVHFKGIARQRVGDAYRVPIRERVHLVVKDAGDSTILDTSLTTNAYGSFSGVLALSSDVAVGTCSVSVTIRDHEDSGYFFVAEYRKPEFEVSVKSAKPHSLRGEPISFTVTARYYWGEPVRDAPVHYTLRHSPEWYYPNDEDSEFLSGFYPVGEGGDEESGNYGGEETTFGEGKTDSEGRYTFTHTPQLPKTDTQDYRFTLEAEVGDVSRFSATARGSTLVTRGAFRLEVVPSRWVVAPAEPLEVTLRAVDYDGKPQSGLAITLAAGKSAPVQLSTGSTGQVKTSVPSGRRGDMRLVARARDARGNEVSQTETVWVTDGSFSSDGYGYAGLEIVPDRNVYKPGDTASVLINVAKPGGYALFSVEGDALYEHRVLRLTSNSTLVKLPIPRAYLPNVYISVVTVRGRQFDHQDKMLRVTPREHLLNVSVTADQKRLHPGDKVTFTIKTTDVRGRPVDAEASFGLVDEAIYAIRPDRALDGIQYFYQFRQNRVSTSYSFPEIYLADEPKDGGPTEIRKDFPDTARWFPDLRTGPTGVRKVTIKLPDSLTTWRATVRAHTTATQVGSAIEKIVVSKDLFVRLETPRFLTQNDRSLVSTIVHNDTDGPQAVRAALTATGVRLERGAPQMVDVPPASSRRLDWPLVATEPGSASFQASAIVTGGPQDAMARSIPIIPHGTESRWGTSGELQGAAQELNLGLPPGSMLKATTAQVTINATEAGVLLEALEYLNASDYGTTENVVGWFLPDMTVAMTFKQLGVRYAPLEKRLREAVPKNLARLYRLQVAYSQGDSTGGGWGWGAGANEDPFWTAYALYGLVQARKAGYAVDSDVLDRGRTALVRLFPREKDPSNRALICYVLTQAGRPPRKEMSALVEQLPELEGKVKNYAIALLALAMADVDMDQARPIAARLSKTVKQDSRSAYWPEIYPWGFYSCNDNETTGYAMMALIRTDPNNPLIEKAARWLIQKRQGSGWVSTEDTASITYALGAYLRLQRQRNPADFTATLRVNGQEIGKVRVTPATMFRPQAIPIPATALRVGGNQVRIEQFGTGKLIYGVSYKTYLQGEDFQPELSGLWVKREYFRKLRLKDIHGNRYDKMVDAGTTFRPGDEIYVRLTLRVRDPGGRGECREVVLRDPIPAGCEGIDEDQPGYETDYAPAADGRWWDYSEHRREIRDRQAVFFASFLHKGDNVFHYRFRAAIPGDYHVLPATASAVYIPEISGRSGELRVRVRD